MHLIILISLASHSTALSAYDCGTTGDKVIYQRGSHPNCSSFANTNYDEKPWEGTVLQLPLKATRSHRTCNLVLRTYTMYCTYSRNPTQLELLQDDTDYQTYKMTGAECEQAWKRNVFRYKGTDIKVRGPGVTKILIGADIDSEGFCLTTKTTSRVIKGQLELVWSDVEEWLELSGNPESRTLDGSLLTWIEGKTASSTVDGVIVLNNEPVTITCGWETIHQGTGSLLTSRDSGEYLVISRLPGGFKIGEKRTICQLIVYTTDDPSIFIVNSTMIDIKHATNRFQGRWGSIISSGITGLNLLNQIRLSSSNKILLENQCILEFMIKESIIQTAQLHPATAALSLIGNPGWTMIVAGDSVVLKRCLEIPVKISPQILCYTDIPVTRDNSTELWFASPVTRVLQKSSFQIECNDDALPMFTIRKQHYKLSPNLSPLGTIPEFPSRLSKLNLSMHYAGPGLYSHEILDSMERKRDHTSRKEEVGRQLLKLGDGSFHHIQDGSGVLGNLVGTIMESAPGHWLMVTVLIFSALSVILNITLWVIIYKSRLWLVFCKDNQIAAYQAQLLSVHRSTP